MPLFSSHVTESLAGVQIPEIQPSDGPPNTPSFFIVISGGKRPLTCSPFLFPSIDIMSSGDLSLGRIFLVSFSSNLQLLVVALFGVSSLQPSFSFLGCPNIPSLLVH